MATWELQRRQEKFLGVFLPTCSLDVPDPFKFYILYSLKLGSDLTPWGPFEINNVSRHFFQKTQTCLSRARSYWWMLHRPPCLGSWSTITKALTLICCNGFPQLWEISCGRLALSRCWPRSLVNLKDRSWFPDTWRMFCHQEDITREPMPFCLGRSLFTAWNAPGSSPGSLLHSVSSYVNYLRSSFCLDFMFSVQNRKTRACA